MGSSGSENPTRSAFLFTLADGALRASMKRRLLFQRCGSAGEQYRGQGRGGRGTTEADLEGKNARSTNPKGSTEDTVAAERVMSAYLGGYTAYSPNSVSARHNNGTYIASLRAIRWEYRLSLVTGLRLLSDDQSFLFEDLRRNRLRNNLPDSVESRRTGFKAFFTLYAFLLVDDMDQILAPCNRLNGAFPSTYLTSSTLVRINIVRYNFAK